MGGGRLQVFRRDHGFGSIGATGVNAVRKLDPGAR
jgi:hypothetical protein